MTRMQDVDVAWLMADEDKGVIAATADGGVAVLTQHDPYQSAHDHGLSAVVSVLRIVEPGGGSHTYEFQSPTEAAEALELAITD